MTDKWQCIKCKVTQVITVATTILDNTKVVINSSEVVKVMCHDHVMRNLSEAAYIKETELNNSGARDLNCYRK